MTQWKISWMPLILQLNERNNMYFHFEVDPEFLNPRNPKEMSITTFIQIYETIVSQMGDNISPEHASQIINSFRSIIVYMGEIPNWELTSEFQSLRSDYMLMVKESIDELSESIKNYDPSKYE